MKKRYFLLMFVSAAVFVSCSKKPAPTPTPPPEVEENIAFSIDPDPGATIAQTNPGTTHRVKVTLTSKMPSTGITIDVSTKRESDNSDLESAQSIKTTTSATDVTIGSTNNFPSGVVYNVTIKVTSQKTATNSSTKSFKVARK